MFVNGQVEKRLDLKDEVNFKIITSQPGNHATAIRILPEVSFFSGPSPAIEIHF